MNVGAVMFIMLHPARQPHNPAVFCVLFFAEPNPEFKKKKMIWNSFYKSSDLVVLKWQRLAK